MAPVAVVVLASFPPVQLQSRTQIAFVLRVCTSVLFIEFIISGTEGVKSNTKVCTSIERVMIIYREGRVKFINVY